MRINSLKIEKFSGGGVKQYIENIAGSSNILRGLAMNCTENLREKKYYKDKITELVGKIDNLATLKFILLVIENYLKSRGI